MKIQSKHIWLSLSLLFCMLIHTSSGCVSVRNSSRVGLSSVANCNQKHSCLADSAEFCPLYDRQDVLRQWALRLNPVRLIPGQVTDWTCNQRSRCIAARTSFKGWIRAKKEEASAPPWPHFHPVPTKPVFASEANESLMTPEVYGQFGKG